MGSTTSTPAPGTARALLVIAAPLVLADVFGLPADMRRQQVEH